MDAYTQAEKAARLIANEWDGDKGVGVTIMLEAASLMFVAGLKSSGYGGNFRRIDEAIDSLMLDLRARCYRALGDMPK
jgi:hypothetical protein